MNEIVIKEYFHDLTMDYRNRIYINDTELCDVSDVILDRVFVTKKVLDYFNVQYYNVRVEDIGKYSEVEYLHIDDKTFDVTLDTYYLIEVLESYGVEDFTIMYDEEMDN